jgi:hypothetical protein
MQTVTVLYIDRLVVISTMLLHAEMLMLLQVVLEVIDENVAQGSRVYEQGHVSLSSCGGA